MVIYTREEKVLIIPEGEGCGCQGGGGHPSRNCEREKREAYESGYTAGLEACSGGTCVIQPLKAVVPQFDDYPVDYQMDIYPDTGYDGLGRVSIDKRQLYEQGYEAGIAATDCSSAITEAYQSGITYQKSLLGSVTFRHNNTFTNHSGWSSVTVNVPKEVVLGQLVTAPLPSQLQNDKYYIEEFKSGLTVDGWGRVQLDMTQMLHYGRKKQRDLFSAATFTENGVYTRENGWSAVTVNVQQSDCSSAITEAYQSGYTAGSLMDVELYFTTRNTEEIEGHTKVTFGLYNGRDLTIDGDSYNSTFEALFPQFQVVPYSFRTKVDIHNVTTVSSVTFTVDCNGQENWIIPSIQTFSINGHQVSNMSFSYVETTPSSGSFIKAAIYTITFDEIHI